MLHIAARPQSANIRATDGIATLDDSFFAPLDLGAPFPFNLWRGTTHVTPEAEYPDATLGDFVTFVSAPAPVCASKVHAAPYAVLGTLQDAPLSHAAQQQWARRGLPGLSVGRARSDAHVACSGAGILQDYDVGDPDILVDGPAALARLGVFGLSWPSHSYGLISEKTGQIKRGGRLLLVTDRPVTIEEFLPVSLVCNKLTGEHTGVEAMKPSQPQGLPVRRDPSVTCPVYVSPYHRVLKVDALLAHARAFGLDRRPRTKRTIVATPTVLLDVDGKPVARSTRPMRPDISRRFSDGVEDGLPPVDLRAAIPECPMLADGFARGGDGDPEPYWFLKIYAAAFDINPRETAHALSSGDHRYTVEETDQKLQTTAQQQSEKELGWPACATFAQYAPHCATCRHRNEGKSPLHFAAAAMEGYCPAVTARRDGRRQASSGPALQGRQDDFQNMPQRPHRFGEDARPSGRCRPGDRQHGDWESGLFRRQPPAGGNGPGHAAGHSRRR